MVDKNIEKANEIIDKHAEFTDHYADQEYTKEGILKMMDEYALYTELVSEKEIDYAAHEAASKIGANTSSNESKYFKKGAKWLQQRQVKQIEAQPREVTVDEFEDLLFKRKVCDYRDRQPGFGHRREHCKRLAKFLHKLIYGDSPNKVKEPSMCPICGSDDTFSFQQGCHKCRSCDYRFTK